MNAVDLINDFGASYTVTRRVRAKMVNGRAVPGATSMFTIVASVQPSSGRELLLLPELRRTQEARTVYTTTRLYTGGQSDPFEADQIAIGPNEWEVQFSNPWLGTPGTDDEHFKCLVQRVDR